MAEHISRKQELEEGLPHFTGTEEYHRVQQVGKKPVYATDGVKFLCDKAGSYWLIDVIASHQRNPKVRGEDLQTWKLTVALNKFGVVTCDDGNGSILVRQEIPYTDFPMSEIVIYAQVDEDKIVVMLPGEY